jgi:membrane protein implicated in regulation of membrane protease activity
MKELELLKKDWKKQEKALPQYKIEELRQMVYKRSNSLIRTIFIISIVEFLLSCALSIWLIDDEYWQLVTHLHLKTVTQILLVASYAITLFFIYLFYHNYKKITPQDSTRVLMKKILRTRMTVRYYIIYILISTGLSSILYFIFSLKYPMPETDLNLSGINGLIVIGIGILFIGVALLLVWLVYTLLYGILLRKLKRNYENLKKIDL